ncbi:hypothetical protein MPTK2_3g90260P [Marchantia polymorpha subsp. ruderalis]
MRAAKALFENHQRLGYVQGSPIRDHYITSADVYNIKLELDKETWRRHANDRISTELWMKANSSQVVLYQAPKSDPFKPLRLAVTRPLLLDWLLKHGNGGCVAIDGTHGTQKYKYPLYTLMVFDEYEHGHPTVFGFLEKEETEDLVDLLSAVKKMAQHYIPGWMPSCFMTDCADNERLALDIVFPHIPVFLCIYHVRKAWTKKLIEVVSGHEKRAIMNAALEDLCFGSTLIADGEEFDVERFAAMKLLLFYKKFQLSEPQFVKYFQTEWEPCMGQWIRDERRKTCRNNQDTNNAMESMHGHMKDFLYGWRRNAHEQRLDHTVYGLLGDFVMRIWYKDQKKLLGFIPNKKKDQRVIAVIMKTRSMLTVPVTWPHGYAGPALVGSTSKLNRRYLVNWRREKYACECFWSLQGNFCKHQILILRRKGYSETNIRICLGIRFGGIRGGIKELFDKGPSSQIYDFNEDPVLRRELADIEVKDDCHDTFNLTEDTDSPVKKASKPTDLEEEEKIKRVLHTQLVWLKDFFDENPSMLKVGELELRHCIGRIKESHQAWSTGRILPVADMWRTSMLDKPSSSFRKLSWLEKLAGIKCPKPQRLLETGERFRAPTADLGKVEEGALQLRLRKGRQKVKRTRSLIKQFLQASANREKRKEEQARILGETIDLTLSP